MAPDNIVKICLKYLSFIEQFLRKLLCKKYLNRRVWAMLWADEWMSEWEIRVCHTNQIWLGLLQTTIQIAAAWKEESRVWIHLCFYTNTEMQVFLCWPYSDISNADFTLVKLRTLYRWISKKFRIFNQLRNYSLWPTLTCHQDTAFCITWNFRWNKSLPLSIFSFVCFAPCRYCVC